MTFVSAPEKASQMQQAGLFLGDNMYLIAGSVIALIVLVVLVMGNTRSGRSTN